MPEVGGIADNLGAGFVLRDDHVLPQAGEVEAEPSDPQAVRLAP
jgi:hypothetical protein